MPAPPFTPWRPNPRAVAAVARPLPVPDQCGWCGGRVEIQEREVLARLGAWRWVYACPICQAETRMHPQTAIPAGYLATRNIRGMRRNTHFAFKSLYLSGLHSFEYARELLAREMSMPLELCHIDWFGHEVAEAAYWASIRVYKQSLAERLYRFYFPALQLGTETLAPRTALEEMRYARWPEDDLLLARHGTTLGASPYEVHTGSRQAFERALPRKLREYIDDFFESAPDDIETLTELPFPTTMPLIKARHAWDDLLNGLFFYRFKGIEARFCRALPELWPPAS